MTAGGKGRRSLTPFSIMWEPNYIRHLLVLWSYVMTDKKSDTNGTTHESYRYQNLPLVEQVNG